MSSSQIFTIGTALRRAEDNSVPVEVLVEGQWLRGNIAGLDGDGLVLVTPERTQCVVRNAHISVVRILSDLSFDDFEDETPGEPQAAAYESGSVTYDAPPTSPAGPAPVADQDDPASTWIAAEAAPAAAGEPVVAEADDDRLVLLEPVAHGPPFWSVR